MGCQSNLAPPTQPPHALLKNKRLQNIRCFRFISLLYRLLYSFPCLLTFKAKRCWISHWFHQRFSITLMKFVITIKKKLTKVVKSGMLVLCKVNANLKMLTHHETLLHSFLEYLILVGQYLHQAFKYFWIMTVVLGNAVFL